MTFFCGGNWLFRCYFMAPYLSPWMNSHRKLYRMFNFKITLFEFNITVYWTTAIWSYITATLNCIPSITFDSMIWGNLRNKAPIKLTMRRCEHFTCCMVYIIWQTHFIHLEWNVGLNAMSKSRNKICWLRLMLSEINA